MSSGRPYQASLTHWATVLRNGRTSHGLLDAVRHVDAEGDQHKHAPGLQQSSRTPAPCQPKLLEHGIFIEKTLFVHSRHATRWERLLRQGFPLENYKGWQLVAVCCTAQHDCEAAVLVACC